MAGCWFCEKGTPTDDCAHVVPLERSMGAKREERSLVIPRCPDCKKEHQGGGPEIYGMAGGGGCGCLLAIVLGIAIGDALRQWMGVGPGIALLVVVGLGLVGVVGGALGGFYGVNHVKPGGRRGKTRTANDFTKHPEFITLKQQGWEPVVTSASRRLAAWQKRCMHPEQMYSPVRPDSCPTCGSNLKTSVAKVVGSMTVGDDIEEAVRCVRCGAWGCTRCAHNHYGDRAANTYKGQDSGSGQGVQSFVHWQNVEWVHDCCCPCNNPGVEHRQRKRVKWSIAQGSA